MAKSRKQNSNTIEVNVPKAQNFVAKHALINRASTHTDKKKQLATPRKIKNLKIEY